MTFRRFALLAAPLLIGVGGVACKKPGIEPVSLPAGPDVPPAKAKKYDSELAPGQLALRKITDPAQLPHFADAYYSAKDGQLEASIRNSLHYLNKPSSRRHFPYGEISHEQAVASMQAFLDVVRSAASPEQFEAMVKQKFDTYSSVGCDNEGTVLFTGYYCPIFDGSLTRTDRFRYPLYKKPSSIHINSLDPDGAPVGGPWKTRQEIESGRLLAGEELVWLGDPFECYVVSVQGSGKIRLAGGKIYEVGYAGNNGHEYSSIGGELIKDGKLTKEQLSLDGLIAFFHSHPQDLDTYLNRNKRYIFFQEVHGGPFGCLGEPVLPLHSIAVDKSIYPRACLALVNTQMSRSPGGSQQSHMGFMCDQDRGGAIRAAGRCDIFRGTGEEAGKLAGRTFSEGRLYYVFLKPELVHSGAVTMAPSDASPQSKMVTTRTYTPLPEPAKPSRPSR